MLKQLQNIYHYHYHQVRVRTRRRGEITWERLGNWYTREVADA